MELDVESLKLANLCTVLSNKNWQYRREAQNEVLIKDLIHAAVCWLGRRESHMAWDSLEGMAGFQTANLSPQVAADVHASLKSFYRDHYMNMTSPLGQHPLKIEMGDCVLEGTIPIVAYRDIEKVTKSRIEFMLFENTSSKHLFMKNVLVRLISIWASTQIKERFKIVNINLNDNNHLIEFEPTGHYVENSRKVLRSMIESNPRNDVYPSEDICSHCQHLEVCPI